MRIIIFSPQNCGTGTISLFGLSYAKSRKVQSGQVVGCQVNGIAGGRVLLSVISDSSAGRCGFVGKGPLYLKCIDLNESAVYFVDPR